MSELYWNYKTFKHDPNVEERRVQMKHRQRSTGRKDVFPRVTLSMQGRVIDRLDEAGEVRNTTIFGLLAYAYGELDRLGKTLVATGKDVELVDRVLDIRIMSRLQDEHRSAAKKMYKKQGRGDRTPPDLFQNIIVYMHHKDRDVLDQTMVGPAMYINIAILLDWALDRLEKQKKGLELEPGDEE